MLTEKEKALIDAQIRMKQGGGQVPSFAPTTGGSFSSLTPQEKQLLDQKIKAKGGAVAPRPIFGNNPLPKKEEPRSIFGKAADKINSVYEGYKNLPGVKQATQVVGGAVGLAGGAIGGVIGAVGNPIANIAQGRPLFENFSRDVVNTAKSTGGFGYDIGKEGAAAAPLGVAGKVATIPLAYSQGYQGYDDIDKGIKNKDTSQIVQGGLELGTAFLGAKSALTSKGLLVNKPALAEISPRFKASQELKQVNERAKVIREVLGENKTELKQNQNAELRGRERDVPKLLAQENVKIDKSPDGKLDTTRAREDIRSRLQTAEDELRVELKKDPTPKHSILELRKRSIEAIDNRENLTASEKKAMRREIETVLNDEMEARGVGPGSDILLSDEELHNFKRGLYNLAGDYTKSPNINAEYKNLANKAKTMIEEKNPSKEVERLNKREGDLLEMDKSLSNAHGRPIRGRGLSQKVNKVLGGVIGSHFGPLGAIVGSEIAGALSDYQTDPARKTGIVPRFGNGANNLSKKIPARFSIPSESRDRPQ